ncbi:MAG TPA: matrixin family metalloprotease [Kofleriaceae bacterium]|nr:matrixin family metalloprotease [Kofleriaceae bacterium]
MSRSACSLFVLACLTAPATAYDLSRSSSGAKLHWDADVAFVPALDGGPVSAAVATEIAARSIATWQAEMPGPLVVTLGEPGVPMTHANDGVSTIRWAVSKTDPDLERGLLARTFTVYRTADGVLRDADIVLDAASFSWTTTGSCANQYDVESALTHELGHALGIAHAIGHPEATMFATGDACEITKRDLATDDMLALAELYTPPPVEAAAGGCSAGGDAGGLGLALALSFLVRRRRAVAITGMIVGLSITRVHAAPLRELPVTELAEHAAFVVRGHVVTSTVTPALETETLVAVGECLAGTCPPAVLVRRHGGERDGIGLRVDGEAELARGDAVVLFVRVDRAGHHRVLGGVQGAWHVTGDRATRDLTSHRVRTEAGWVTGARQSVLVSALRRR